jgi:hypothetical protein
MPARGVRFRPPRRPLEPAVRWALARAFWPLSGEQLGAPFDVELGAPFAVELGASFAAEPEDALRAVETLRLERRVASRVPEEILVAELGEAGARTLREARRAAVARGLHVRGSLLEVLAVARELGVAPVLLKFAALEALGVLRDGSRGASDVDLLLDAEEARALRLELVARGWRATGERQEEHHLAAVCRPGGAPIEIHTRMLGVRLRVGDASADATSLARAGLLEGCGGELEGARVPDRSVVAAHLLVHGLAQHGSSPRAYPMLQPFADLIDLGWPTTAEGEVRSAGEAAGGVAAIASWVERSLGRAELEAAARLCSRLTGGDASLFEEGVSESPEVALLHHSVRGMLDARYAASLRLQAVIVPVSDLPGWRARLGGVFRAIAPRSNELAAIYGERRPGPGKLLWLRIYRPFDLAGRTLRTLVRKAQLRGR